MTAVLRYASFTRFKETDLITLDSSILPAIIIFLSLLVALNYILFKPLARIQAERQARTTGLMAWVEEQLNNQLNLFNQYQAAIKNARIEGYKRQEQLRSEALQKAAKLLAEARELADSRVQEARESIQAQVEAAKLQLASEAQEIAKRISSRVLERAGE